MPTSSARPRSLRRRLLVLLLGLTALTWLATATIGYLRARHEAAELLDAHLAQAAALLVAQSGEELDEIELEHAPALDRHAPKVAFQLWEDGRQLRLHSRNAPNERFSPVEEGFSDATHGGDGWRVFSAWDAEHELLIQVGERSRARDEIAAALGASLALPLAVALPLLGFAIWWSVGAALRPLERLRHDLSRRDPLRLAALDPALAPEEVRPLVEEINTLFARIDTLLQRERRFTADAAHELRSPLAALATQAQVARAATDDAVRSEALEALVA
ncbi:MAG TPA: sensor histidine kinase N-terminal domain-containing protein, partial [Burkholderiales bacterium]|nr:sensor histidine kinase N-terminal domain-containing protein [Burkholderiales bacterium]